MINRAAVNTVVKMLQSKTVANKDGKRVLGLVKSGSGPSIGIPADTIVVDIAVIFTWRNRRDGWSKEIFDETGGPRMGYDFSNAPWVAHTRRRANHCMAEHAQN